MTTLSPEALAALGAMSGRPFGGGFGIGRPEIAELLAYADEQRRRFRLFAATFDSDSARFARLAKLCRAEAVDRAATAQRRAKLRQAERSV